ncbi:MAG: 50S ribosomal protein L18 [Opitutaceae bacterium]|nr:50S ribosomal protein L18 [Opitutaceae bacterium]|tara:strand:- start:3863 stop:4225 length:363 start_codon:yes stop_codon:yes gene_type:complete
MKLSKKIILKQKRRWRIRKKIAGTADRPRLAVHLSNKHVYGQLIDDDAGKTLVYVSTNGKDLKGKDLKANIKGAQTVGKAVAEKAKKAGVEKVIFDRSGRRYHGCVKAFGDAAREGGLNF